MTGHQKDDIFLLNPLHGCPQKIGFGPKTAFLDPKRATLGNRGHETARQAAKRPPTGKLKVSRVTSGYGGLMILCTDVQKKRFRAKNSIFGPQKGHFGQSGPRNGPPAGQTATYRKTEGIQSYLRIWGTYDPIKLDPSNPKKWGIYGCSVKKSYFRANFGPKKSPCTHHRSLPSNMINT